MSKTYRRWMTVRDFAAEAELRRAKHEACYRAAAAVYEQVEDDGDELDWEYDPNVKERAACA